MTGTCFGGLGGVRSCWGYKVKLVIYQEDNKDTLFKNVRLFSLKELRRATNNFNTKVGEGGFSSCYKGTLDDGSVVAVLIRKKESESQKAHSDFVSLINVMSKIRHRNVVQLIGCCVEGDSKIVVYEYVGDKSLDEFIYLDGKRSELSWPMRASICTGIARGLEYLHQGISHCVVHRDINPGNIILDCNFNPKIVDFGLAESFDDGPHHRGELVGTLGYIDPEYYATGIYTEKADVYAFGILLMEVISGRNVNKFPKDRCEMLVDWVLTLRKSDMVHEIVDPNLYDYPKDEMIRFIDVALSCVQVSSILRPSMSEVLLMLMGGYDFSNKTLRNPEQSWQSDNYNEGGRPGRDEIALVPQSKGKQNFLAGSTFRKAPSQPALESMSKTTSLCEIEVESDLDTHCTGSELMEISHDLETEIYRSVEEDISTVPGPSDKNALKSEVVSLFSLGTTVGNTSAVRSEIHIQDEAVEAKEHLLMSHDLEAELQMSEESLSENLFGQTAVKADVKATSSAEVNSFKQTEVVDWIPFPAEVSETGDILSQPKVVVKISIDRALEKILDTLLDAYHRRISLYGRGGSGKSIVLENLFHHPAINELFDQVLFVTVPRLSHPKHVQDEIVQQLSINVPECCSEEEIPLLIHQTLMDRKVLVLLDDVWEPINLHEVGIPNPGPENRCWLVLATRSLEVCHVMSDRVIEVEVLSDVEAWELFCSKVGHIIDSSEINPAARAISMKCYGSPVLISAIGSALRAESSVEEWKHALRILQFGDTPDTNYCCFFTRHIKYCYDRLKARDIKTCFLYTALFQEDREIDICALVECFISEGLVGGTTSAAYRKGHDIVGHLTHASLLEADNNGLMVKMHNVVRNSALEILSSDMEGFRVLVGLPESEKDDQSFWENICATKLVDKSNTYKNQLPSIHNHLTRAGAHLKETPSMEEWEQATMIFLMDNELSSLPSKPSCPNLVALFLQRNSCLRVIPTSFFDCMSALKILNLSKTRIKSLPNSFSGLRSLQILLLRDCERLLLLPPSIGLLKFLEVLDLQGTEVTHLPDSVGELGSLKQLRVSFYGSMNHREYHKLPPKLVSDGIISSLRLRELGIFVYPGDRRWALSASIITKEISCQKLSVLYFHFLKVENLEHFVHTSQSWKDRDLTVFSFVVGHDFKRVVPLVSSDGELLYNEGLRCLRFVNGESTPDAVIEVLTRATSFYLDHHLTISNLSQFGIACFDTLKYCILRDCPELLGIVDSQEQEREFFPLLEYLSMNYLWKLKRIWAGHVAMGSFARLRCLSVHACPKLSYVLTSSMLDILSDLEELVIQDCVSLKYVVIKDEDVEEIMYDDVASISIRVNARESPALHLHSLKVLKLHYLPEMCGIWTARWPPLQYISFYDCPKLRNLHMKGKDDMHIKEIAADKVWWDSLEWDDLELSKRLHNHVTQPHIDKL